MNTKKIVITGAPGTGKSTLIDALKKKAFNCLEEISRQITLDAQKQGVSQFFLSNPLLFSELLLEKRRQQFFEANNFVNETVFFDRGIPDILAYLDYTGTNYFNPFTEVCKNLTYHSVFLLHPWEHIYTTDNERYETFNEAEKIHHHLVKTYKNFNYNLIDVPFDTVENRTDFILKALNL